MVRQRSSCTLSYPLALRMRCMAAKAAYSLARVCHAAVARSNIVEMRPTRPTAACSGKLAALLILALAFASAVGAGWYYYRLQCRPLRHWGADHAQLIVRAPRVWIARLTPASRLKVTLQVRSLAQEVVTIDGRKYAVAGWKEISRARGLANIRHVFINDHAYEWTRTPVRATTSWRYLLRFESGVQRCMLVMNAQADAVQLLGSGRLVSMAPAAAGLRAFIEEQWASSGDGGVEASAEGTQSGP